VLRLPRIGHAAGTTFVALAAIATLQVDADVANGAGRRAVQAPLEADFNGDGFADLAVGVPGEDVGSTSDAGVVDVLYGSGSGLTGNQSQQLTQALPEAGDAFGAAVAAGDFNGDGFGDLAVGAPGENVGATADAGAVEVFFGSTGGLPSVGDQLLRQGAAGLGGAAEAGDFFGAALASGDFDAGGLADLVVGVPGENVGASVDAGAVNVIYGGGGGLLGSRNQLFLQSNPEDNDIYGATVAAADLNPASGASHFSDLIVGAPGETVDGARDAGAVTIVRSPASGEGLPIGATGQAVLQGSGGVPGAAESGDLFGAALAGGDFGSGGIDLAVGVPGEDVGQAVDAGAVNVVIGPGFSQLLTQGARTGLGSVPGALETGDLFGASLASGDFDGNNADNLAIGAPGEDLGSARDSGIVVSLCGFDGQFFSCPAGILTQPNSEAGDLAGASLAAGDYNNDGLPDLAAGAPGEAVGAAAAAGAVDVHAGEADSGLPSHGRVLFQGDAGVPGSAERGDQFAYALAGSLG
jgi:hypothetical protein